MGVSSAALLMACAGLMAYDSATARTSLDRDVGILADVVAGNSSAAVSFGDPAGGRETLSAVAVNKNVRLAAIVKDGTVFARFDRGTDTTSLAIPDRMSAELMRRPSAMSEFDADRLRVVRPIVYDGELLGGVYIEGDLDELQNRQRRLIGIMTIMLLGSLGVAFILSYKLQRVVSGPVLRLTEVTREVSRDKNFELRVEPAGQDEVGVLIDGFNQMLTEIQRRDRQLTEHHEALEREVAIRTADLRAANHELLAARDNAMAGSRAKSEFLANISHEIRTPMNGIVGMTELALDSTLTVQQRDCLDTVKSSAGSLLCLLNDILDFSKIESQKLEFDPIPFSLADLVDDTLKPFAVLAGKKHVELIADVRPEVPHQLVGDPGRIAQIVANLVGNAVKFTERGHVLVRVRCDEDAGDTVTLHVAVSDTGIGIPKDKHEAIFGAFSQADGSTTRRFGGTGLGLTISSSLVRLMGGRLWVESEERQGSTFQFTLTLPVAGRLAPSRADGVAGVPVLVVDDSDVSRRVLCDALNRWGMTTAAAADAAAAFDMLTVAARAGRPFGLVIVDAGMPGVDGFSLAEQMARSDVRETALLMMLAANGRADDAHRCQQLGIEAHVSKPVRRADLLSAVRRALGLEAAVASSRRAGAAERPRVSLRVLLAEDNPVNQKVAVGLLTRRGHSVHVANNGLDALAAWETASFDVVLMDIQMPEMGGIEATRAIREREALTGRHTRIVAMTAHAMKGDREQYLAAGMDGYISKPIDHRVLMATIEEEQPSTPGRAASLEQMSSLPIVLDDIQERLGGDEELIREVVTAFVKDLPARLSDLEVAVQRRDAAAVQASAHALKGAAANVSAAALAECSHSLEIVARSGTYDDRLALSTWMRLQSEAERVMAVLGPGVSVALNEGVCVLRAAR